MNFTNFKTEDNGRTLVYGKASHVKAGATVLVGPEQTPVVIKEIVERFNVAGLKMVRATF